jgi:hypothetical protein
MTKARRRWRCPAAAIDSERIERTGSNNRHPFKLERTEQVWNSNSLLPSMMPEFDTRSNGKETILTSFFFFPTHLEPTWLSLPLCKQMIHF